MASNFEDLLSKSDDLVCSTESSFSDDPLDFGVAHLKVRLGAVHVWDDVCNRMGRVGIENVLSSGGTVWYW